MRPNRTHFRLLLMLALSLALPACRSVDPYDASLPMPGGAMLVVRNDNFADMVLYAVSSGLATRIGMVTGLSTATFALSSSVILGSDFHVVATPIGGNGRASTGILQVASGTTVHFTIAAVLSQSSASVR